MSSRETAARSFASFTPSSIGVAKTLAITTLAARASAAFEPALRAPIDTWGLYPFQVEGARWLDGRSHALLADEPGLGKSVQIIRALRGGAAVIVCPASLRLMWRDQFRRWSSSTRVTLARAGELEAPGPGSAVIASYDSLPLDASYRALARATLILDEAHRVKSADAERTARTRAIAAHARRVWVATGTPLVNTPADLWAVLEVAQLGREAFGSWDALVAAFGGMAQGRSGSYEWPSAPALPDAVKAGLARVMLRRLRSRVLPDLPAKTITVVPVEVPPELVEQLSATDRAWRAIGLDALPPFELVSLVRAALAKSRTTALLEYVELHEHEPLVVFGAHVEPLLALRAREGWEVVTGETPVRARDRAVARFQAGELRGIALSIGVGGVGFTLTRGAHAVFVSASYNPADNEQAEDRLARIGQRASAIRVTYLVSDHPVERRLLEILSRKRELIRASIDSAAQPPSNT